MTTTINSSQEENLSLYLQICADSYKTTPDNPLSSEWEKLNLVINNKVSGEYYYDLDKIFKKNNGFDAAIYYNATKNEVIVGIRGTEPTANDGDVEESANILNHSDELTQFNELDLFHEVIQATLTSM